jgi:hypothetical protein
LSDPIFILASASIAAIGIPTIPGPMTPIFSTFHDSVIMGSDSIVIKKYKIIICYSSVLLTFITLLHLTRALKLTVSNFLQSV